MEQSQSDRDSRVARILDELDDVEAEIAELHPANQTRSRILVLFLLLVLLVIGAALVTVLVVPGAWDLAPFLIAAGAFALTGLKWISSKNEELAELKQDRARLIGGPP
jgi:uncharacterized integral membrane protein